MKVAIVSTPRTCSSMLGNVFSRKFDLLDYSEFFSETWIKTDACTKLKMLHRGDNFSVKITSTSLTTYPHLFNYTTFPWEIFDYIVVTERLDICQQTASWLLLSHAQLLGKGDQPSLVKYLKTMLKTPEQFPPLDMTQVENIVRVIHHFQFKLKPYLLSLNLPSVKLVNYEMFQTKPKKYIDEFREKTDIYWRVTDLDHSKDISYMDYSPYIDANNLRQVITNIIHELELDEKKQLF